MKLEIDVISREVISPSSPTPRHLKNYKLSFLDQTMPPLLTPFFFFYPANHNLISNAQRSNHLKKSLSQALTLFYPLAGRLVGNSYVNCNDEGATYVEAQANSTLSDVITDQIPEEFSKLVPCDPVDAKDHCMAVQATFFCCGGLALGLEISHKLFDGYSHFMFLNSWASFSRGGDSLVKPPMFESALLFPPKDLAGEIIVVDKKENIVTKRFVFSTTKITELRDKYTKTTGIRPTRIEALSAFIGTRFMAANGAIDDTSKIYALRIFVDIRTRVVPPLSEYHFGNIVAPAITVASLKDGTSNGIVKKMRDAISNVDGDTVANLRQGKESLFANKASENEVVMLSFTNYCSYPLHEANFGWGMPTLIVGPNIPVKNMVFFNNSISGGVGIDARVNLKRDDMIKFEADKELLEYVSNTKFMSRI